LIEFRVVIVGPEESKWKNLKQVENAKELITQIITNTDGNFPFSKEQYTFDELVIISGACPKGGVDIWTEECSYENDIVTEICPPEINSWNDEKKKGILGYPIVKIGYRTRNLRMAKKGNLGYCIVPHDPTEYCKHCKKYGHPSNGGCWTILKMRDMRKEGLIIEV